MPKKEGMTMKTINIGIFAHVDSGKTSIVEQLLYKTDCIRSVGTIKHGDTQMDSMDLEKKKGITIQSSVTSMEWKDTKINIIDTPGHIDFVGEVYRSVEVIDLAILVVTKKDGVKSHTKTIKKALEAYDVPYILFVNKMDIHPNEDYSLLSFEQNLNSLFDFKYSSYRVNHEVLSSDDIAEIFEDEDVYTVMANHKLSYLIEGSAKQGDGIISLLDCVHDIAQMKPYRDETANPSALVFKIVFTSNEKLVYIKVVGGLLSKKAKYINNRTNEELRITRIEMFEDNKSVEVDTLGQCEIACLRLGGDIKVGDVLGAKLDYDSQVFSKPFLNVVLNVKQEERTSLLNALDQFTIEDPLFKYNNNKNRISLILFGYTQLDIVTERLRTEFKISVTVEKAHIIEKYRAVGELTRILEYGDIRYHLPAGLTLIMSSSNTEHNKYVSSVDYGYLTKSYQIAVRDGVMTALSEGIHERELMGTKVEMIGAVYDSVLGTPAAFRKASEYLVREMLQSIKLKVMKPIVSFLAEFPQDYMSVVFNDINNTQPIIYDRNIRNGNCYITGEMKLEDAINYQMKMTHLTSGNGLFSFEFLCYKEYDEMD